MFGITTLPISMNPEDILNARETRANMQNRLLEQFKNPVLTLRVNYPGIVKDTPVARGIFRELEVRITHELRTETVHRHVEVTAEGPMMLLSVGKDSKALKEYALHLEETHPLGRFVDLDVYTQEGSLSRTAFGRSPRSCYLCGEEAHGCVRSRAHSCDDLLDYIDRKYLAFLESRPYDDVQNF